MIYAILKTLHLLSVIVWLGGMVFTHFFLRPALHPLDPAARVPVMHAVLTRFFRAVTVAIGVILISGLWMIGRVAKQVVQGGGSFDMPMSWTVMAALGILMMLLFVHIRVVLFKRLTRAVEAADWQAGAQLLHQIRSWVAINLVLGVVIVVVTLVGWPW